MNQSPQDQPMIQPRDPMDSPFCLFSDAIFSSLPGAMIMYGPSKEFNPANDAKFTVIGGKAALMNKKNTLICFLKTGVYPLVVSNGSPVMTITVDSDGRVTDILMGSQEPAVVPQVLI